MIAIQPEQHLMNKILSPLVIGEVNIEELPQELLQPFNVEQDHNQLLEFTSLNAEGWDVINHVMTRAKRYYSDEKYRNAVDTVITDMAASF
jgi:hypothetical protein